MLGNYAERVRFVRSLTKLSREAFGERYGINKNTLKSWELGINTLTEKSAKTVANAIQSEGFSCSAEWLIFGLGSEPRPLSQSDDDSLLSAISQHSKIMYEAEYFKKNNHDSVTCMITDSSMEPFYKIGDYVGGINRRITKDLQSILTVGKATIITLSNNIIMVRKVLLSNTDSVLLCPLNDHFQSDVVKIDDILSVASIVWHRTT